MTSQGLPTVASACAARAPAYLWWGGWGEGGGGGYSDDGSRVGHWHCRATRCLQCRSLAGHASSVWSCYMYQLRSNELCCINHGPCCPHPNNVSDGHPHPHHPIYPFPVSALMQNPIPQFCCLCSSDLLSDLAYSSQADVLLGVHSESLFNAFFMPEHSSVIEIRPLNYTGRLSNQYMKDMSAGDGHSIFWWGVNVVNPAHSAPSTLELQKRGAPHTWPRERHTFIRLMALQYLLERIALTRNDKQRYMTFRDKHENYINDMLDKLNDTARHHRHLRHLQQRQQQPPEQ
eukprot:GHUV01044688.1.p1 GENE.GHUV01044688.1~~GHUV01044688.1.p1  ORF type:complete len:289 (+),score=37.89 GHUV01044688.1:174-1040(+)